MNTLSIITVSIFVLAVLSGLIYTMYKGDLIVKHSSHKMKPLKSLRTKSRPETFSEFLKSNAIEALIRLFEPVMLLRFYFLKLLNRK